MKKHLRSMWTLGTFATLLTVGITLNAQQSTPTPPSASTDPSAAPQSQPTQPADPTAQQPNTPTQAQPSQTPDQGGQAAPSTPSQPSTTATDSQTFQWNYREGGRQVCVAGCRLGKVLRH